MALNEHRRGESGFSLVEVMVAGGLLALLAGGIYHVLDTSRQGATIMAMQHAAEEDIDEALTLLRRSFDAHASAANAIRTVSCGGGGASACGIDIDQAGGGTQTWRNECQAFAEKDVAALTSVNLAGVGSTCLGSSVCAAGNHPMVVLTKTDGNKARLPHTAGPGGVAQRPLGMALCATKRTDDIEFVLEAAVLDQRGALKVIRRILVLPTTTIVGKNIQVGG